MIVMKYREKINIELVIQSLDNLLKLETWDLRLETWRIKPWWTGHAIWCAREAISGAFIVINADDFYGCDALFEAYDFLLTNQEPHKHCIVTCPLNKMLSDYGTVSRGICSTRENKLITIVEHTKVCRKTDEGIVHTCQDGSEVCLPENAPANMNLFWFQKDFIKILDREMRKFFTEFHNELTREFFLPAVVMEMIENGEWEVSVLPSTSEWFGMTNKEDRTEAVQKIQNYLKKHQNIED
jgi:NDP-sugar pyrophosphorylase family protein